jgi:hypothetical protein
MRGTIAASGQNRHNPDENPPYSPAAEFNGKTDEPAEEEDLPPMIKGKKRGSNPARHRRGAVPPGQG